ncbi:hypothetical protein KUCAC02_025220, partial [Chaenocephalus aceratus]
LGCRSDNMVLEKKSSGETVCLQEGQCCVSRRDSVSPGETVCLQDRRLQDRRCVSRRDGVSPGETGVSPGQTVCLPGQTDDPLSSLPPPGPTAPPAYFSETEEPGERTRFR